MNIPTVFPMIFSDRETGFDASFRTDLPEHHCSNEHRLLEPVMKEQETSGQQRRKHNKGKTGVEREEETKNGLCDGRGENSKRNKDRETMLHLNRSDFFFK